MKSVKVEEMLNSFKVQDVMVGDFGDFDERKERLLSD